MIHEPAKKRIMDGTGFSPDDLVNLMEMMASQCEEVGNEAGQMMIGFLEEEDEFVPGTYVPEVWIIMRKVLDD